MKIEKFNNMPSLCFVEISAVIFQKICVTTHGLFLRVTSLPCMCYFGIVIYYVEIIIHVLWVLNFESMLCENLLSS
jgi:hypothetical protein